LGDTLMLAVQTLRLMQTVGMAKSEAEVIRDRRPIGQFTTNLMLQTIRKNVVANVCTDIFRALVDRCMPDSDDAALRRTTRPFDEAFLASLLLTDERAVAKLMQPLSNVFELVRSEEMYTPIRRDMLGRLRAEVQGNLSAAAEVLHGGLPF
jgi:hypothetical protein